MRVGPGEDSLSRRQVLSVLAGGAVGGLAGCASGGNEVTSSSEVFGHALNGLVAELQLNPWATSYASNFASILFEYRSTAIPGSPSRLGDVVDGIEIDGTDVVVRYADGFRWWNGEPVTARDQFVEERIRSHLGNEGVATVTLVDDYTIRYELDRPLDRPLVFSRVLGGLVDTADWLFEPWLDRLDDATTDERVATVHQDLRSWTISLEMAMDEGFGCGPYRLSEVSPNRIMLDLDESHPRAEELSISRLWFPIARGSKVDELMGRGWLDGGRGTLESYGVSIPDHVDQLTTFETNSGKKLVLNWRNDHLARRGVRRALASVLPLPTIVDNADWGTTTDVQTGLTGPAANRWLSDDLLQSLHRYPVEADREQAAEFMRSAGYERRGGDWYGPEENRAELYLQTPRWRGWAQTGNIIARVLENFGIAVEVDQLSNSAVLTMSARANYDMLLWWTVGRPHSAYDVESEETWSLGYGVTDPTVGRSPRNMPIEVPVPSDPSDPTAPPERTINLVEQWRRIRRPTPQGETAAATALLAQWWNYDLPHVSLATNRLSVWGNTRDFEWPDADDPAYRTLGPASRPEYYMLKAGSVQSRTNP